MIAIMQKQIIMQILFLLYYLKKNAVQNYKLAKNKLSKNAIKLFSLYTQKGHRAARFR